MYTSPFRKKLPFAVKMSLAALFFTLASPQVFAQLSVNNSVTTAQLISALLGNGLNVSNVVLNCPAGASGTFTNGNTTNIGISNGILLTTGQATNAIGPNNTGSGGTCNGTSAADPQLVAIEPLANEDLCSLQFDLIPTCNNLQIRFVFASEEYPEFVNGGYNDAFGFFISGPGPACQSGFYNNTNVATLPNNTTPVSIDNVNAGNNSAYYVNNNGGPTIQYDGFTTVLTRNVALCPCQSYHFKLAIADAGDCNYDSGVFVDFISCSTALSAVFASTPASSCSACNGTASVTASGGNPGYSYSWSPSGGNGPTATGLCAGNYTCTITDQSSCTPPVQVVVNVPGPVGITSTSTQTNPTCSGGNNGTATANPSGGVGPYTYNWAPSGGTAQTATGLSAGTYTCTITDANGCSTTQQVTITQPSAVTASANNTSVSCNGGSNGSATVTASGGTPGYTYAWSPSGGNAATASGLSPGTYTCTITDANGCFTTQQTTVTQPSLLTSNASGSNVSCNGGNNGTAIATSSGGTPGYTYAWSPTGGNAATATGLTAGTYTVTVTDANGCTSTHSVALTQPSAMLISTSAVPASCGGNNGSATASTSGGTPGYSYSWSPAGGNAATASGLAPGNYTVTVTDAASCVSTQTIAVTQTAALQAAGSVTNVTCNGAGNGSGTVTPSGGTPPFTYSWSSGGTAATETGLSPGTYTCTITDINGCTGTQVVTITQPAALNLSVQVVPIGCNSSTSASGNPSGGTGPYTYSWSSGGNAQTENNLAPGNYTLVITDANGCTATQSFNIAQPVVLSTSATSSNLTCFNSNNGSATVTTSGGNPPYTYSWSPSGGTNATASGLSAGTYTCTITDTNGCTTTQTVSVTQPPTITSSSTSSNVLCNGGSSGAASVTASGGTGTFTYSWSPAGGTNATASGLSSASYTCTITDQNGCASIQTVTITQPQPLNAVVSGDSICPGSNAFLTSSGNGGTTPYSFSWSNGPNTSSQSVNPSQSTTYTVSITDANGCTTSGTTSIIVIPAPVASITSNTINGVFQINAANTQLCFTGGSTGVQSWSWDLNGSGTSNAQSPCVTVSAANIGSYCAGLIVANAQGCLDTTEVCIEISNVSYSIPNVFTPGSDGTNDAFIITNEGMKTLHCEIYNRWGEMIYQWEGTTGNWNGKTTKGDDVADGVYYYTVHMVDLAEKVYNESGFVELIREK